MVKRNNSFKFKEPKTNVKPFLAETQAADLIGIHPLTLKNWRQKGIVKPSFSSGKRVYYARKMLEAFLMYGTMPKQDGNGNDNAQGGGVPA